MLRRLVAGLLIAVVGLAGCSQTAALAPVSGGRLAEIRFAVNDVLVSKHVRILVAPVCTASGSDNVDVSCAGTTLDHLAITALSTDAHQQRLTVKVGSRTIFAAPFQAVLDSNAQPHS